MKINRSLLTNFNPDNDVTFYQNVTAESLSGTGTRMVVANSAGLLSTQAIPSGTIGGSGTANYIPKFATGTSLGNSVIYENSSNIGINNTNPLHKLHITQAADGNYPTLGTGKGAIFVAGDTNLYGLYVGINTTFGDAWLQAMRNNTATAYNLILQPAGGNVLVNQTTDSGERLQVTGSVKITSNLVVDTDTLYVDATKNAVGIGKAPISFYSDDRTIQLGYSACLVSSSSIAEDLRIGNNVYFDSSGVPKRIAAGSAAIYSQFFNTHIFQSAASSTAGSTITWTDQMQILDDGTTLIATNSSSGNFKLQVNGNTFTNGEIKTAAPTGGTARNWRLGDALSDSGATADTKIEVEINGTTYYLMAYSSAL